MLDLDDVEADSLRERPALPNGHQVANLQPDKTGRAMRRKVLVSLLVAIVFSNVVEVLAPDDDCPLHLGADNRPGQNAATDRNIRGEGALPVDVGSLDCLLWGAESKPNILVPPAGVAALCLDPLVDQRDSLLLLKRFFRLEEKLKQTAYLVIHPLPPER